MRWIVAVTAALCVALILRPALRFFLLLQVLFSALLLDQLDPTARAGKLSDEAYRAAQRALRGGKSRSGEGGELKKRASAGLKRKITGLRGVEDARVIALLEAIADKWLEEGQASSHTQRNPVTVRLRRRDRRPRGPQK